MTTGVLIAEDDAAMRQLLLASLTALGGRSVEAVRDGSELRSWLERHEGPRVLVSDIHMPGWSGLGALRWLSEHRPSVSVVLTTSFCDSRTYRRAHELGAIAVLVKPFDMDVLCSLVSSLFSAAEGDLADVAE